MNDYTALEGIMAPNTAVFGYQRGDAVGADVVENWGLEVGVQVCEGDLTEEVAASQTGGQRPGPEATYGDWQAWAIANGMPTPDAGVATIEQLQNYDSPDADSSRPADSANKAAWVAYVEGLGASSAWAEASTTTKADLQAWQPGDVQEDVATDPDQPA